MDTYLPDGVYAVLVRTLANHRPDPLFGCITEDQVKFALGEIGDIWPASILPDVIEHSVTGTATEYAMIRPVEFSR